MIDCMPGDEELDLKRHMRGHVDKSEWIVLDEESVKKMNDKALMGVLSKVVFGRRVDWIVEQQAEAHLLGVSEEDEPI